MLQMRNLIYACKIFVVVKWSGVAHLNTHINNAINDDDDGNEAEDLTGTAM